MEKLVSRTRRYAGPSAIVLLLTSNALTGGYALSGSWGPAKPATAAQVNEVQSQVKRLDNRVNNLEAYQRDLERWKQAMDAWSEEQRAEKRFRSELIQRLARLEQTVQTLPCAICVRTERNPKKECRHVCAVAGGP